MGEYYIENDIKKYLDKKENLVLTLGYLKNNQPHSITLGPDGKELGKYEYKYEIGSITKLFTTALMLKAVSQKRVELSDTIDKFLRIEKGYYPTLRQLATHTAGYEKEYPFNIAAKVIKNQLSGHENPYTDFDDQNLIMCVKQNFKENAEFKFQYSNYDTALLGYVLSKVYRLNFKDLIEQFCIQELGIHHTSIAMDNNNLLGYYNNNEFIGKWKWNFFDGFLPTKSLVSTVGNLLKFAAWNMSDNMGYLKSGHEVQVNTDKDYDMGYNWMIDKEKGYSYHAGHTGGFNTYLAIDEKTKTAVTVLSNYAYHEESNVESIGKKMIGELAKGNDIIIGEEITV